MNFKLKFSRSVYCFLSVMWFTMVFEMLQIIQPWKVKLSNWYWTNRRWHPGTSCFTTGFTLWTTWRPWTGRCSTSPRSRSKTSFSTLDAGKVRQQWKIANKHNLKKIFIECGQNTNKAFCYILNDIPNEIF